MNVKDLRTRLGMTQQELARLIDVSVLTVKSWESGRHAPKGQRFGRLIDLEQQNQSARTALTSTPVHPEVIPGRRILRLGEAVRLMGLKDEGHGRRSDHTIRKAIKRGTLLAWKAPGAYRANIGEWCFFADDFETWRAKHYQAHRDPRGNHTQTIPSDFAPDFAPAGTNKNIKEKSGPNKPASLPPARWIAKGNRENR
jgi:transcriptional regulator with XRE-family HTH domain